MSLSTVDRRISKQAGYEVSPDPDQPRLFQWIRLDTKGQMCDACDVSFPSERSAWKNAITTMIDAIVSETEISWDDWSNLSEHMKVMHMCRVYDVSPSPTVKPPSR